MGNADFKFMMPKRFLLVAFVLFSASFCVAQPGGGGDPGGGEPVPISGIEILIGMGALLGGKKVFDRYKAKNNSPKV